MKFRAKLEPVPHGGQYVVVPAKISAKQPETRARRLAKTLAELVGQSEPRSWPRGNARKQKV